MRPTGVPECAQTDVAAIAFRGQGGGGWWVRGVVLGNRGGTPCIVSGPLGVSYLDAGGATIATASLSATTWSAPGWAVLDASSPPVDDHVSRPGQGRIILQSYGDCAHRELHAIAVAFAGSTGTVRVAVDPQPVGGRCDVAGQQLGVSSSPIESTDPVAFPVPSPPPLALSIAAPSVAFAGETLSYMVRIRNISRVSYAWSGGCPIYVETLGGREATPSLVPGRGGKWEPPAKTYVGFAKEIHPLNCAAAGAIVSGSDAAFEMRIAVPRDAFGPDTLYWAFAGPFPSGGASTPIEFLAPRR
jgi:hypothetical protein